MKLDAETARELAYGRPGDIVEGFEVMENEMIDTTRWSIRNKLVIRNPYDNSFWRAYYSVGATEIQDERPFEYDYKDVIEFEQVEPHEVVTVEYRKVS